MESGKSKTSQLIRRIEMIVIDLFILFTIYTLAYYLHGDYTKEFLTIYTIVTPIIVFLSIALFIIFRTYETLLIYYGFEDIFRLVPIIIVKNFLFFLILTLLPLSFLPLAWFVPVIFIETAMMLMVRIIPRAYGYIKRRITLRHEGIRTLIVGAGAGGSIVLKEMSANKRNNNIVVGFVDDDVTKIDSRLHGIKVYGPIINIKEIMAELDIEEVIIAVANISAKALSGIARDATEMNAKVRKMQITQDIDSKTPIQIVSVKVEDLLHRSTIELDKEGIKEFIKDQVVLVTGGGGSIGSELCRQIALYEPKQLIIFDIYENNAYDIQMELARNLTRFPDKFKFDLKVVIGSVYNEIRLEDVFKTYTPDIVFHAAAYKHVPLMEANAVEALRTNIIGTDNVAKLSSKYNIKKMILVSSDKAVRPTNVMGASKRFAEHIIQSENELSKNTSFSAVRFGNVLGSNGSVVPLFTRQIQEGGPVTVTHKEMTRYFMTIPEAVSLILQAAVFANGGEIFVLDMGEPVKILELAERMISLAGFSPYKDIKIEFIGLRPGEKLYEELLIDINLDKHKASNNDKIFVEHETHLSKEALRLDEIRNVVDTLTNEEAKDMVKEIITSYVSPDEVNNEKV